jgi:hypothetical protein
MTREKELKMLQEFIEKNGTTKLPPDERGPDFVAISAWRRSPKKRGRKKAAPKVEPKA